MKISPCFKPLFLGTLLVALLLSSCSTAALPVMTQTPYIIVITNTPTVDLAPFMTQAAETVFAQMTGTAAALPSQTPLPPTNTPTTTATSTSIPTNTTVVTAIPYKSPVPAKTSTPKTPSATATQSGWNCEITFQLVDTNHEFGVNEDFDARWTIKNTGSETWDMTDVDFRYMSGTEMQQGEKVYDLPSNVSPDGSITITVDMKTPGTAGYYETFWALARHSDGFCWLPTRVRAK